MGHQVGPLLRKRQRELGLISEEEWDLEGMRRKKHKEERLKERNDREDVERSAKSPEIGRDGRVVIGMDHRGEKGRKKGTVRPPRLHD